MKAFILLPIVLLFSPHSVKACWGSASQQITVQDDTISIVQTANFCLGSGPTCPYIESYNFDVQNNIITLDVYYNLTHPYPAGSCTNEDTIREQVAYGEYTVVVNSWVIGFDSTYIAESDTTYSVALSLENVEMSKGFVISPNPSSGPIEVKSSYNLMGKVIDIYNTAGSLVYSPELSEGFSQVISSQLERGIYVIYLSDDGVSESIVRIMIN